MPSYPFEEDISQGSNFMQTRVPAWCDRILLSPPAKSLIVSKNFLVFLEKKFFFLIFIFFQSSLDMVKYGIIGANTCMGDHKVKLEYYFNMMISITMRTIIIITTIIIINYSYTINIKLNDKKRKTLF